DGGLDCALPEGTCGPLAEAIDPAAPLMRRVARFVEQRAERGLDQRSLPDQFVLEIAQMVVRLRGGRSRQEYCTAHRYEKFAHELLPMQQSKVQSHEMYRPAASRRSAMRRCSAIESTGSYLAKRRST